MRLPEKNRKPLKRLWAVFWSFMNIWAVTIVGRCAMVPSIGWEVGACRRRFKEAVMADNISLSSATPRGIGVKAAAFIGYIRGWRDLGVRCRA